MTAEGVESMIQIVTYGGREVKVETGPMREPAEGQVLIRVAACGICGSDLSFPDLRPLGELRLLRGVRNA